MTKLLEVKEEELDKLCALQIKGVYFFLQSMVKQMASGAAVPSCKCRPRPLCLLYNHAAYIATKSAATRWCAASPTSSAPRRTHQFDRAGLTGSPMTATKWLCRIAGGLHQGISPGRIGTATDIANAALWLVGEESFITGQVLQINGGLTLRRNPTLGKSMPVSKPPGKTVSPDCLPGSRCYIAQQALSAAQYARAMEYPVSVNYKVEWP